MAASKTEGPATCLCFLGIKIDTISLTIRLPANKLVALQDLVRSWLGRSSCLKKELESLVGSLSHACCVVMSGKTFLRRLFELLSVARRKHHYLRLNNSFKSDLWWWHTFLAPLNHASFFRVLPSSQYCPIFYSDASGSIGCRALWSPSWFQVQWSPEILASWPALGSDSITFKKMLPIVWVLAPWGPLWKNASVTVYCDNLGAVAGVNSGYSKIPRIMHLLRCLFFLRAQFNIELIALQVPAAYHSRRFLQQEAVSLLLDQQLD